ncbi:MAG: TIR domain-containing protein [Lachnospiraceae bacterium]|nr:TIR domain-containing protein [Lachnospiraceae bacterium]
MADVFISHSSKDKEIAEKVLNFFEGRGLNCWIAPRDIVPGTEWAAAINAAITASKVFLIIYTVNSAESSQVSREISLAETKQGVFVVPYKTDDTPLVGSFEYYLVGSHFISADYSKNDYKLEELYTQVADIVGGSIPQPDIVMKPVEAFISGGSNAVEATIVRDGAGILQDNVNKPDKPLGNNPDKSWLPLIIGIAAAAVVVIAVILIIVLGSGEEDTEDSDKDILAKNPTSVETEPNVTDEPAPTGAIKDPTSVPIDPTPVPTDSTPTPIEDTPTPTETPTPEQPEKKEIKDFALQFLGHDCTGDYNGYVNASGQPQGEGVFIGTYYADYSEVRMTYTGEFKDGLANGKGISTETFVDGYVREYEGDFQGGVFDGEGTEKSTSVAGDRIEYNGSFKAGKYNGKGIKTVVNKAATPEKQVYEGTWEAGEFISGKRTGYDADGYMILSENVAEKDEKAVLMDYVTDHGNYDPDQMKYCLTKTYDELYSIIRDTGSGRTVYDTNVSINVYSYDSADDILEFTIDNNDLGVKVSVTYNSITGKYDFSSKEHLDNGDLGGMISGIFRDYLYGSEDNLTYVQAVRTTKEEFADNTRLLVNLLKRCLTDMLTEYDIGVSLDSLGLDYWH